MTINAPQPNSDQSTHEFAPTGISLPWPEFLQAWANHLTNLQPGPTGLWLSDLINQAAIEAHHWRVSGPAEHSARREREEAMDAAYLRDLEATVHGLAELAEFDAVDPGACGSLIGPDEHCMRALVAPNNDLIK